MNSTVLPDIGIGIKCFTAIEHSPLMRSLRVESRRKYSFMTVICGSFHYKTAKGEFYAEQGDTVFLPKGATYEYAVTTEEVRCYQTEFQLFGALPDMPGAPVLLPDSAKRDFFEEFPRLINAISLSPADGFKVCSILSGLLCHITREKKINSKIKPAVEYLEQNFCEPFSAERLAFICALSPSQLRRIFSENLGCSPIKYRNRLRINKARRLLESGEFTVFEIAEALKFDTGYAFSKAFKAETGLSPKQYQKKNTINP